MPSPHGGWGAAEKAGLDGGSSLWNSGPWREAWPLGPASPCALISMAAVSQTPLCLQPGQPVMQEGSPEKHLARKHLGSWRCRILIRTRVSRESCRVDGKEHRTPGAGPSQWAPMHVQHGAGTLLRPAPGSHLGDPWPLQRAAVPRGQQSPARGQQQLLRKLLVKNLPFQIRGPGNFHS